MGDMGDLYNSVRLDSKNRRAAHRKNAPHLLIKYKINFTSKNNGAHLIIQKDEFLNIIDFWPGTGKWIDRETHKASRGIKNLINFIKES